MKTLITPMRATGRVRPFPFWRHSLTVHIALFRATSHVMGDDTDDDVEDVSDGAFEYVRARTSEMTYYAPEKARTRAEATYEVVTRENGGSGARAYFDTRSARGYATFDAKTCVVVEFTSSARFRHEGEVFEKLRGMRTFREHFIRKSFDLMRAYARGRKIRRAKRALADASAVYGDAFASDTARAALEIRGSICERIRESVRAFRREELAKSNSADAYDFDAAEDARGTTLKTYDVDTFARALETNGDDAEKTLSACALSVRDAIARAREAVEHRFRIDLNERLRPMIAATKRYRASAEKSFALAAATSCATTEDSGNAASTAMSTHAPREMYAHTERALSRALDAKLKSFERSMWLAFQTACVDARRASMDELRAHIMGVYLEKSSTNDHPPPLFETTFDYDAMALAPGFPAFERVVRAAAERWTSDALRAAHGAGADFPTHWSSTLGDEERAFEASVEALIRDARERFDVGESFAIRDAERLRADANALDARDDAPNGEAELHTSMLTRVAEFKRELERVPNAISPTNACVAVDVSSCKRSLKIAAARAFERTSDDLVSWTANATQSCANALTRMKLSVKSVDAKTTRERIDAARASLREIAVVVDAARAHRVKVPDLNVAAFDALAPEIDAFERTLGE